MNNKIVQRLLVFFIGLPVIIGVVYFKQLNHIALHILIVFMSLMGANELYTLLSRKYKMQPKPLVLAMNIVPPLFAAVCAVFNIQFTFNDFNGIDFSLLAAVMVCMAYEVLAMKTFESALSQILTSIFIILYTGFFITFLSRMTVCDYSREYISIFLLMVFLCDSAAWFFGNLFGKNNKGFIKASPNKSIAGFCGGILGSVVSGLLGWQFLPGAFPTTLPKIIFFGIAISIFSILGDLFESVIKRSVEIKDSGTLIPGRGGVLDSIDSVVFAVPVFYLGINFLFASNFVNQ